MGVYYRPMDAQQLSLFPELPEGAVEEEVFEELPEEFYEEFGDDDYQEDTRDWREIAADEFCIPLYGEL
jgi:hypothetical protein